jgi:lysyl-tRNA synthetase class 2
LAIDEQSQIIQQRYQKLSKLRASNIQPYKSSYKRTHTLSQVIDKYKSIATHDKSSEIVRVAGRLIALRRHGKASFAVVSDGNQDLQLYLSVNSLGETSYKEFLNFNIGDIVGVEGPVFRTRRGELSVAVDDYELLSKSLRPLPEKWHGLKDVEIRYRQRYADLIVNKKVREVFNLRSQIIKSIRRFLDNHGFVEVETPMLQPIPGGASARPFTTYHNALNRQLYLRIAPELYLKRLIVGGYDKIYELNRSFRNEGISIKHNPEFTMLELYQAYADYKEMMNLLEKLVETVLLSLFKETTISYQGTKIDFKLPWRKMSMLEALEKVAKLRVSLDQSREELSSIAQEYDLKVKSEFGTGKIIAELFERLVEPNLVQPTIITAYPKEITPLARSCEDCPEFVERFEFIVAGREIANAFSELTDPVEQRERFEAQAALRSQGDEEAQFLDEDYLRALEYGLPPTGGMGIGIDRLVMLLTDMPSIRDVIFFPHLKAER